MQAEANVVDDILKLIDFVRSTKIAHTTDAQSQADVLEDVEVEDEYIQASAWPEPHGCKALVSRRVLLKPDNQHRRPISKRFSIPWQPSKP